MTQTARERWRELVDAEPSAPCLTYSGQAWTREAVDREMRRRAAGLAALGVGAGTRVLAGLDTTAGGYFTHMAVRELGAVLVALVPSLTLAELEFQINHSGGEVLLADGEVAETLSGHLNRFSSLRQVALPSGPPAGLAGLSFEELAEFEPRESAPPPGYDSMSASAIFYTSGSTSKPKGVVLPDGSLVSCGKGYAGCFGLREDDNFLLPFTLAHGVGGLVVPGLALASGCAVSIEPRFSPSVFWDRVRETGSTVTLLFPAQLQLLMRTADPAPEDGDNPLRQVLTHVYDAEFAARFEVEVSTVWGSTENGACGAGSGSGYRGEHGEGFIGGPLSDEEITLRDPEGRDLGSGMEGEIWLRHPHVMIEYLSDPEATAETLKDGWVRTGDRGMLDEQGRLYYRGRFKNMVKRSGENISPEEVEAVLSDHPRVIECVVFGVPDPVRTEELAAHVSVGPGEGESPPDPGSLSAFVAERLARWKAPRYVRVYEDPFPRLASGKADRVAVKSGFDAEACWDRER